MAEQGGSGNLGDISYSVSADTEDLLVSAKQVDSSTKQMATSFQELTKKIAGTESGSSKLAAEFGGAGKAAAALENEISRLGGQVQANGTVVDQFGVRNAKLTSTLAALRGATFQTTSSFRMMRGGMQQIGYQVQDVAVQLQMGQNALMVLGQQGSQVASIFGTGGAIFGAILAVSAALGTAMMPALFNSKSAVEELEKAMESLNEVVEKKDGVIEFTDELRELAEQSKIAALALLTVKMDEAQKAINTAGEGIADAFDDSRDSVNFLLAGVEKITRADSFIKIQDEVYLVSEAAKDLGSQFGLTGEEAEQVGMKFLTMIKNLRSAPTPEGFVELQNELAGFVKGNGDATDSARTLYAEVVKLTKGALESAEKAGGMREAYEDLDGQLAASAKLTKEATKSYVAMIGELSTAAATTGMSAREQALYNAEIMLTSMGKLGELEATQKLINGLFDEIEAKEKAADATKKQTQAHDKARESLDKLIQTSAEKSATLGMDARELAKHTALQLIASQGLDVNTEAVLANIDAIYDSIEAKDRAIKLEKQLTDQQKQAVKTYEGYKKSLEDQKLALATTDQQREAFIERLKIEGVMAGRTGDQIQRLVQQYRDLWAAQDMKSAEDNLKDIEKEIQLQMLKNSLTEKQFELQSALLLLGEDANKVDENGVTYGERLQEAIEKMQELRFQAQLLGQDLYAALQDVGVSALDSLSQGLADVITQGGSFEDTLKGIARTISNEVLGAVIRYFIGKAAAAVMGESTETSAALAGIGMVKTAQVASATAITAAMTPAALAANIATSGGAATAAAATFPIANNALLGSMAVAKGFAGALGGGLLYGGSAQAGKIHPILEDGKPEMLTMGNKNYLMTPQNGIVTSNKDMTGGGANIMLNINNYAGVPVDVQSRQQGNGTNRREVLDIVIGDIRDYGETLQAITEVSTTTKRTR